jgi:hypothetical protein
VKAARKTFLEDRARADYFRQSPVPSAGSGDIKRKRDLEWKAFNACKAAAWKVVGVEQGNKVEVGGNQGNEDEVGVEQVGGNQGNEDEVGVEQAPRPRFQSLLSREVGVEQGYKEAVRVEQGNTEAVGGENGKKEEVVVEYYISSEARPLALPSYCCQTYTWLCLFNSEYESNSTTLTREKTTTTRAVGMGSSSNLLLL